MALSNNKQTITLGFTALINRLDLKRRALQQIVKQNYYRKCPVCKRELSVCSQHALVPKPEWEMALSVAGMLDHRSRQESLREGRSQLAHWRFSQTTERSGGEYQNDSHTATETKQLTTGAPVAGQRRCQLKKAPHFHKLAIYVFNNNNNSNNQFLFIWRFSWNPRGDRLAYPKKRHHSMTLSGFLESQQ